MMTDLGMHLDELKISAGKVEALAAVCVDLYDNLGVDEPDPLDAERLAHLLGATHDAAMAMVLTVDHFRTVVADAQPAEAGDDWGDPVTGSGE